MAYLDEYYRKIQNQSATTGRGLQENERREMMNLLGGNMGPAYNPNAKREALARALKLLPQSTDYARGLEGLELDPGFSGMVEERVAPGRALLDKEGVFNATLGDVGRGMGQDQNVFGNYLTKMKMAQQLLSKQMGAQGQARLANMAATSGVRRTASTLKSQKEAIDKLVQQQKDSGGTEALLDLLESFGPLLGLLL